MVAFSSVLVASLLAVSAQAANDWSKPCFGECDWDIHTGSGSGTMRVSGSHSSVSDLTTAAGWEILDCDANTADQDIRLVCADQSKGCDHLNTGNGAAGTLVRLPTSCGSMPFALVGREWVHQDQSIPASKRSKILRRDGSQPVVKGIALSTDFASADPNSSEDVALFLQGSSIPGLAGNFSVEPPSSSNNTLSKRDVSDWFDDSIKSLSLFSNNFNKNITGSSPINFEKDAPLFDKSIDCPQNGAVPAFSGSAKVDLNGKVTGNTNYGVVVAGRLFPPKVDEFGIFVNLDATVTGTVGIEASLTGTIGTGSIPLFETGIPALDFPEIFSLGPTFSVSAHADATLDANVNLNVDIDYDIQGAQLFFPPGSNNNGGGSFTPGDSNLNLAVSPNITSHGQLSAHLVPSLAFGIELLKSKATIHLDVDGNAAADLSLTAGATASVGTANGTAASADFGGCVDVTSGIDVTANADADLLSIFKKGASVSLFSKEFDLFKKCFGDSAAKRAYTGRAARAALLAKREDLGCPTSALGDAASVVQEAIPKASIV